MQFSDRDPIDAQNAKSGKPDPKKADSKPPSEPQSDRAGGGETSKTDTASDADAQIIEQQIGPGLRSMYSTILKEELPDDLLAVVEAMASKEKKDASAKTSASADDPLDKADRSASSKGGQSDA